VTSAGQRPISIRRHDRDVLDTYKQRYEQSVGETMDWGRFLATVALLGLAAAGIYSLVRASQRSPQSVDVQCPLCGASFVMAVPEGVGRAVHTTCIGCGSELVVDIGMTR